MDDHDVKISIQEAAAEIARRYPGRAFSLFVWPADPGQRAQYVSNAPRNKVIQAMRDLCSAGLPGIPGAPDRS